MNNAIFRIACVIIVSCSAITLSAQEQREKRVDDSQLLQMLVVGDVNSSPATWFKTNAELAQFASRVHLVVLDPSDPMYAQRFAPIIAGPTPLLLLQRPDGGVIYAAGGMSAPRSATQLVAELREHIELAKDAERRNAAASDCLDGSCKVPVEPPVDQRRILPWNRDGGDGLLPRPLHDASQTMAWTIGGIVAAVFGFLIIGGMMLLVALFVMYLIARGLK